MLAQVGGHFAHLCIIAFLSLPAAVSYQQAGRPATFQNFKFQTNSEKFQTISIQADSFNVNGRY
jgi:hypothetical protein